MGGHGPLHWIIVGLFCGPCHFEETACVPRRAQAASGLSGGAGRGGGSWKSWGLGVRVSGGPQTHRCVVDIGVRPLGRRRQVFGVAQPLSGGHAATGSHSAAGFRGRTELTTRRSRGQTSADGLSSRSEYLFSFISGDLAAESLVLTPSPINFTVSKPRA